MAALNEIYPPSKPCSCEACKQFCLRPGWWTVEEAERAFRVGFGFRMMLELSPDRTMGVLSPAFKGNEAAYAMQLFSKQGCTFLKNGLCDLFGTGLQPLECRYCRHDRIGKGQQCHLDIEKDWHTDRGQHLVAEWMQLVGIISS